MGKKANIKEAAEAVGITEWALRQGINQGKYSFLRLGNGRGRIIIDIDTLKEELETEAEENKRKQAERFAEEQKQKDHAYKVYKGSLSRLRDAAITASLERVKL